MVAVERRKGLEDIVSQLDKLSRDVGCLARGFEKFQQTWLDTLETSRTEQEQMRRLKRAVIEKSVIAAAWAMMVFLAYATWAYVQQRLGR